VNPGDYHTITLLEEDTSFAVYVYDVSGTELDSQIFSTTGSFNTVGIGPQNLVDNGMSSSLFDTAARITIVGLGLNYSILLPLWSTHPCGDEYIRFAFINEYGFWDYYNVYNPLRSNNQVDRSLYERSFVSYEDSIGSYNISNRGNTQYRTEYDKRYIITTDFIDKEMSQWLTELFESPEVFVQQNGDFVPINITNTSIRVNMNTAREKLFQYDIEFKYANQPQPR
jgi:hypothetical protein